MGQIRRLNPKEVESTCRYTDLARAVRAAEQRVIDRALEIAHKDTLLTLAVHNLSVCRENLANFHSDREAELDLDYLESLDPVQT